MGKHSSSNDLNPNPSKKSKKSSKSPKSSKQTTTTPPPPQQPSPFHTQTLTLTLSLPPSHLSTLQSSIRLTLNSLLTKYYKQISGVVLTIDKIKFKDGFQGGRIHNELPHVHFNVECEVLLYRPPTTDAERSVSVKAVVNKVSGGHVGAVVYGLFNASVGGEIMTMKDFVFEAEVYNEDDYDENEEDDEEDKGMGQGGRWNNKETGEIIQVGSVIEIKVLKVNEVGGIVAIEAEMA